MSRTFNDVKRLWRFPKKHLYKNIQVKRAKAAWAAHVTSDELGDAVYDYAKDVMEGLEDENKLPPITLSVAIKRAVDGYAVETAAPATPVATPLLGKKKAFTPDDSREMFQQVWDFWSTDLVNPDRPEFEATAWGAWNNAIKSGVAPEDILLAAKHYRTCFMDPHYRMRHAMHLKRFLRPDDDYVMLREWVARARYSPSPAAKDAFGHTYRAYPHPNGYSEAMARDDFEFWRRHIPERLRLDFYCACRSYSEVQRRRWRDAAHSSEAKRYTLSFPRFVSEWRLHLIPRMVDDVVSIPLYDAAVAAGYDEAPEGGVGEKYLIITTAPSVGVKLHRKRVLDAMIWALERGVGEGEHREVVEDALRRADLACFLEGVWP